jgi:hypothetical protein
MQINPVTETALKQELSSKWDYKIPNVPFWKISIINLIFGFSINLFLNFTFVFSLHFVIDIAINSIFVGGAIWKGSQWITIRLIEKYSWLNHPLKRILYSLLYIFLLAVAAVSIFNSLYRSIFYTYTLEQYQHELHFIIITCLTLTVSINIIIYSYIFLRNWKQSVIQEEVLKREQLNLQYETLKTQINPQLLFGSLGALKNIVNTNAESAAKYVKQLSEVYRYSLDQRNKDLIELNTELDFLNKYVSLRQLQFSNIDISIPTTSKTGYVLPLSLQMIVERLIDAEKNSFSSNKKINITISGEYISINFTNTDISVLSDETIEQIANRYKYFTDAPLNTSNNANNLEIQVPIISMKSA